MRPPLQRKWHLCRRREVSRFRMCLWEVAAYPHVDNLVDGGGRRLFPTAVNPNLFNMAVAVGRSANGGIHAGNPCA